MVVAVGVIVVVEVDRVANGQRAWAVGPETHHRGVAFFAAVATVAATGAIMAAVAGCATVAAVVLVPLLAEVYF